MTQRDSSKMDAANGPHSHPNIKKKTQAMNDMGGHDRQSPAAPLAKPEAVEILSFLEAFSDELEGALDLVAPNAHLRMMMHLLQGHLDGKTVTPTSLIGASRVAVTAHYPSDVLFGAFIGIFTALWTYRQFSFGGGRLEAGANPGAEGPGRNDER